MSRAIVILRPEPGASLSANRAADMELENVVTVPLFKVRPTEWSPPDPDRFDAILMTSANAARHGGDGLKALRDLPVHAVGEATAAAARAAGLMIGEVGEDGVDALLETLPKEARLLHLAGRHRHAHADDGRTIVPVTVYSSETRDDPRDFDRVAGAIACLHSARAGKRLAELVERESLDRETIALAAISEQAGEAAGEGWEQVDVATNPRDRDLLALAARMRDKQA